MTDPSALTALRSQHVETASWAWSVRRLGRRLGRVIP
jgi:hypothetical protein